MAHGNLDVPMSAVTNQSWSEPRIGLKFGSEQSYQILEEGNGIGLGFNLCVVPPQHYAGYVLQFWDGCWRPELDNSQTEIGQKSEYRGS